ncbi:putative aspartate aminotransferase, cytoplasmic 2 isoform X2 [Hemicordylus capensis]|uniref:putative aspartate aminotransferase, cytoplasmic 2 isoform X2 n=1 Tax=Hemicordylus capensis TaxID=884348 RepID=UPI002303B403|nr:putative aspartate aminotransferase, cytoplasmic 2 isoform X2 [Hemicordylus capensis]
MGTLSVFLDVPLIKGTGIPLDVYRVDPSPQKVCLGHAGCQTESDEAWIPPVVRRTLLQIPQDPTLTHEYLPELGVPEFNRAATELVLGKYSRALLDNRAGGVQTIGGTGAVFIGAEFLRRWYKPNSSTSTAVYIAIPQLGSLGCIFQTAGFNDIRPYQYWDPVKLTVNIQQFLLDLQSAPERSIVFLHAPEETGLSPKQWGKVATVMEKKHLFPFFDVAAQGLASGNLDRDAWALRHFVARGFELLCAQSFSKTFGLYEERVGNLIVVTKDNETLIRIQSQLAKQVTMIWYGPTSLGARLITMVLNSPALLYEWKENLLTLVKRIMLMREKLKEKLRILGTPGSWEHLTAQAGTNSFIGLLPSQVEFLEKQKHIYLLPNNQINICSINSKNLDYIAQSIHEAVMSG